MPKKFSPLSHLLQFTNPWMKSLLFLRQSFTRKILGSSLLTESPWVRNKNYEKTTRIFSLETGLSSKYACDKNVGEKRKTKIERIMQKTLSSATVSICQSKIKEIMNRIRSPDVPCRQIRQRMKRSLFSPSWAINFRIRKISEKWSGWICPFWCDSLSAHNTYF